jgi:hypothetical protein
MRTAPSLSALAIVVSMIGLPACSGGGSAPPPAASADAGDAGGGGFDSGSSGPCFLPQGEGADAATCLVAADCHHGQICVVAEGCFCTSSGRCFDDPCDGGLSTSCQGLCSYPSSPSSVDEDAGAAYCFVEGC